MLEMSERLAQAGAKEAQRVQRERAEAEARTKLRPTKKQAAPEGLFEQQQELFEGE